MASEPPRREVRPPGGVRFLLVQLGYHAARRFAERLEPLGLEPRHYGVLRAVAALEGATQQAVGSRLQLAAPRMVALIDDLEQRGLVERRRNPNDRRAYGLFLTRRGRSCRAVRGRRGSRGGGAARRARADQRAELERLLRQIAAARPTRQRRAGVEAGSRRRIVEEQGRRRPPEAAVSRQEAGFAGPDRLVAREGGTCASARPCRAGRRRSSAGGSRGRAPARGASGSRGRTRASAGRRRSVAA